MLIALVVVLWSVYAARVFGLPDPVGPFLLALFAVDWIIWSWGIERFDITAPWQFRAGGESADE